MGKRKRYPKIDVEEFKNNITKERAYFLGFLWADGSIVRTSVSIEINSRDMEELRDIFFHTCEWGEYQRCRPNRQKQSTISRSDKLFNVYLRHYDYHIKSNTSPYKILNDLSEENKKYFFRGWIDGDGNFYYNPKEYIRQFSIGGSINQNWISVETLFNILNIKYKIVHYISKLNHKSSHIKITNLDGIRKLYNYLYDPLDGIYLNRKLLKCQEMLKIDNDTI